MTNSPKLPSHNGKVNAERWGRFAEYWVGCCLLMRGYHILHFRYRSPYGEIDLITRKKNKIHFIEVKFRRNHTDISQALPSHKSRKRLMATASYFMAGLPNGHDYDQDFSVVIVAKTLRLTWFHQAFYDLS